MSTFDRSPILAFVRAAARPAAVVPRRPVDGLETAAVFLAVTALLAWLAPALLADPDTLWHVFFGERILTTRTLPQVDSWSWTMAGTPWIAKEWLSQVLFALAFRLGGWIGVAGVGIVAVAAAFTLVAREALARLAPVPALLLVVAIFPLVAGHVLARPHVLAWAPMVAWTIALARGAEEARVPHPAALALMPLWANLHGSFLLGVALVPVFAVEALLRAEATARVRLGLRWALFFVAALGLTALHPYGFGAIGAAVSVLSLDTAGIAIAEWKPTDFAHVGPMEVVLLGGVAALATVRFRLPLVRLALLLALAHLALAHVRHAAIFGLLGAMILVEPLAHVPALRRGENGGSIFGRARAAIALVIALAIGVGAVARHGDLAPDGSRRPVAALAAVRAAGVGGEGLADYGYGGWLITEGVRTFIDGRTELFGSARVADWLAASTLAEPAALDRILADGRIGWTLLPTAMPAVAWLDRSPGWRRLHGDATAVVHVRVR